MLQCVAVCCSVLRYVAVCCSMLQCVAVCCSVLQCVVDGSLMACVEVVRPCTTEVRKNAVKHLRLLKTRQFLEYDLWGV